MKRSWLLASVVFAILLVSATGTGANPQNYGIVGHEAPSWGITEWIQLPDGTESLDVSDYSGNVVVMLCFQSWCPGCHSRGFPTMKRLSEHYRTDSDVVFVSIQTTFEGFNTNTADKLAGTAADYELSMPFGQSGGTDGRSPMMGRYRTGGTPWIVVIDRQGVVRFNDYHIETDRAIRLIDALRR